MGLCLTTLKRTDKVDCSAPIGPLHPASQIGHIKEGVIWLKVNGVIKQTANLNQMIWNVAEQISQLSEIRSLYTHAGQHHLFGQAGECRAGGQG